MVLDKENGNISDGEYIAACIKSPKDLSNIGGNVVDFDASTTRAIKIVNGVIHVLSPDNGDTFSWYWKFMPDNIVRNFVDSTNPLAYRFTAEFPTPGDNSATLRLRLINYFRRIYKDLISIIIMKWVIVIFVGIFLISFVNAGTLNSSTTNTNFSISGCSFEFNNQIIGVATGTCSKETQVDIFIVITIRLGGIL